MLVVNGDGALFTTETMRAVVDGHQSRGSVATALAIRGDVALPYGRVIRGADDFAAGSADTFYFAFGGPKVREVDATVGGLRVLEVPESGM